MDFAAGTDRQVVNPESVYGGVLNKPTGTISRKGQTTCDRDPWHCDFRARVKVRVLLPRYKAWPKSGNQPFFEGSLCSWKDSNRLTMSARLSFKPGICLLVHPVRKTLVAVPRGKWRSPFAKSGSRSWEVSFLGPSRHGGRGPHGLSNRGHSASSPKGSSTTTRQLDVDCLSAMRSRKACSSSRSTAFGFGQIVGTVQPTGKNAQQVPNARIACRRQTPLSNRGTEGECHKVEASFASFTLP